jgi:hypothetical protein
MNISYETLKRIEAQLDRLEGLIPNAGHKDCQHREAWLLAGWRPNDIGDNWINLHGDEITYATVLATMPKH